MFLGGFFARRHSKRDQLRAVQAFVDAINRLDYEAVADLVHPDLLVSDARGREISGVDEYIESDRDFRTRAGRPQMTIEQATRQGDDWLISGTVHSDHAGVGGPGLWRVSFAGERISRIEVHRAEGAMTTTRFHAIQHP